MVVSELTIDPMKRFYKHFEGSGDELYIAPDQQGDNYTKGVVQ